MSLLSFGEIIIDFLGNDNQPPQFTQFPGGAPANVAVAYSKLGGKAAFVGKLSEDNFGRFLVHSLQNFQVDTQYCRYSQGAKTAFAFISLDSNKERHFSFYRDHTADIQFNKNDFDIEAFKQNQFFHFCSNTFVDEKIFDVSLYGINLALKNNCITSFDLNLRPMLWQNTNHIAERVWRAIGLSKIIKMSLEELSFMIHNSDFAQSEDSIIDNCFSLGVELVLITDGANPLRWFTPIAQGKIKAPKVHAIDTTAAGDAFIAGTLFAMNQAFQKKSKHQTSQNNLADLIKEEKELNHALQFGINCGAISVTRQGAFPSFAEYSELMSFC
ncbi:carbohydrate kinase family protein [Aliikangiella sp. IMCC44359]|uniref:carbohydrate kinase family protein n=1 Tax=Aliikangiella sp. IMCC44359 TaxID=3459125 RepID=UPI00403ABCE9